MSRRIRKILIITCCLQLCSSFLVFPKEKPASPDSTAKGELLPFTGDDDFIPEFDVVDYETYIANIKEAWEKGRQERKALPFEGELGLIGEYQAPDPGEMLVLIRQEKKELRVAQNRHGARSGELQLSDSVAGERGFRLEIVGKDGRTVRSYDYRRKSGEGVRLNADEWVMEVADARGKVIRELPLRGGKGEAMRWDLAVAGEDVLTSSGLSYRLKRGAKAEQLSGAVVKLGRGRMFSLPGGAVIPALAGSNIDIFAGGRRKVESIELAVLDKRSGKEVRCYNYRKELPAVLRWDGKNAKGKYAATDRDYEVSCRIVDKHGIRQTMRNDIVRVPIKLSKLNGGITELCVAGVRFSYNQALLDQAEYAKLKKVVEAVLRQDLVVSVEGYTDCLGSDEYNQTLARKRALIVMKHMVEKEGVDVRKLRLAAHGRERSCASNLTREGRRANRRVELVLRLPLAKAGISSTQAKKMLSGVKKHRKIKKGQKLAMMPMPAGKGNASIGRELAALFGGSDIFEVLKLKQKEAAGGKIPECWRKLAKKQKADWVFCAALSKDAKKEFLVVELIGVEDGEVLISDSLALEAGEQGRRELMQRLIRSVLANT